MLSASTLQFLFQLAKGISRQFGPNCEVVVHDLDSNDPNSSIVAIENGHVTGRKVGDEMCIRDRARPSPTARSPTRAPPWWRL